ncbi:hypothetical protein Clacol_000777 [Clathrus columnatus]|uniref:Nucleolar protein 12 n=1 Tax=Clathrus columnatus TaxID=1419009 RepID=A0AAV4ZX66_9AGAM|nr:hypothetical protein Clacol_000777 [Clathrus columnatus]
MTAYKALITEYLTGFHKRNLQKKEAKQKRALERQRQERLELRKQVFQHRQELAERAAENVRAVELALGIDHSDAEIIETEDDTIQDQELEFENDEQLTVVTVVDDLSIDSLRHGDSRTSNPSGNEFNKYPSSGPVTSAPVAKQIARPRLQKVKYETKVARKVEKAKQKARKWKKDGASEDRTKKRMRH